MARTEVRVVGFGGQGVVLLTRILGSGCALYGRKHASMIRSFGPEARGGTCCATLAITDTVVLYPYVREPGILVALSQEGYEKYAPTLKHRGVLVYEKSLVRPSSHNNRLVYGIEATRIAESLGNKIVQNMVMLGFVVGATNLLSPTQVSAALVASVPTATREINLKALQLGLKYAGNNVNVVNEVASRL